MTLQWSLRKEVGEEPKGPELLSMQIPSLSHNHEQAPLVPYLPLSRVISQFRPPMLVSQERMIRPPLDTVIASSRDKAHCHFLHLLCCLVGAGGHDPTSSLWTQTGIKQELPFTGKSIPSLFPSVYTKQRLKQWEMALLSYERMAT